MPPRSSHSDVSMPIPVVLRSKTVYIASEVQPAGDFGERMALMTPPLGTLTYPISSDLFFSHLMLRLPTPEHRASLTGKSLPVRGVGRSG